MIKPTLIDYPPSAFDTYLPWIAAAFVVLILLW